MPNALFRRVALSLAFVAVNLLAFGCGKQQPEQGNAGNLAQAVGKADDGAVKKVDGEPAMKIDDDITVKKVDGEPAKKIDDGTVKNAGDEPAKKIDGAVKKAAEKGIDAGTVNAYLDLKPSPAYYGWYYGWSHDWDFIKDDELAELHFQPDQLAELGPLLPGFSFANRNFPSSKLPDVAVPFGLDLSHCSNVTDTTLTELTHLKDLAALNLGHTGVTDTGVRELRSLKNLVTLNLNSTKVTDYGVLTALRNSKKLVRLDLSSTRVTGVKWTPKTGQSNKLLLAVQERGKHAKETEVAHGGGEGSGGVGGGEG